MLSKKSRIVLKTILPVVLGITAFLVYLCVFNVDIPHMVAIIRSVNTPVYGLAVSALIFQTFFFALSWRSLLNFLSVKISLKKSFLYVLYGKFVDILVPAESISGEVSRLYLVTRQQNGVSGKVVASLVTHRVVGTIINMGALLTGLLVFLVQGQISGIVLPLSLLLVGGTTLFLVMVGLLCIKEKWTLKIVDAMIRFADYITRGKWQLMRFKGRIVKATNRFHDSMKDFSRAPKPLSLSLFFSLSSWFCGILVSYLVFLSIGFSVSWSVIIVSNSILLALKGIPLGIPFEVGLPELTMPTVYFTLLDVPLTVCATATILIRILTVWIRFLMGFAVQQWLGIKAMTALDQEKEELLSETERI